MKHLYITILVFMGVLVGCDKNQEAPEKTDAGQEDILFETSGNLSEPAIAIRLRIDSHVGSVLREVCDAKDISLKDLLKMEGIAFTEGASVELLDEGNYIGGRLGSSQHHLLRELVRIMEAKGKKFSKETYSEEESCGCF